MNSDDFNINFEVQTQFLGIYIDITHVAMGNEGKGAEINGLLP